MRGRRHPLPHQQAVVTWGSPRACSGAAHRPPCACRCGCGAGEHVVRLGDGPRAVQHPGVRRVVAGDGHRHRDAERAAQLLGDVDQAGRHFPRRIDPVEAVYLEDVEGLDTLAADLASTSEPWRSGGGRRAHRPRRDRPHAAGRRDVHGARRLTAAEPCVAGFRSRRHPDAGGHLTVAPRPHTVSQRGPAAPPRGRGPRRPRAAGFQPGRPGSRGREWRPPHRHRQCR